MGSKELSKKNSWSQNHGYTHAVFGLPKIVNGTFGMLESLIIKLNPTQKKREKEIVFRASNNQVEPSKKKCPFFLSFFSFLFPLSCIC